MKLKLLAAASLLALSTGAAQAQSSVTLYGIMSTGIAHLNHAGADSDSVTFMPKAGSAVSRWGLRGSEDLGSGLKTVFTLESGVYIDSGSPQDTNRLFNRQAFVGLAGDWGQVTFGRHYSALLYGSLPTDPFIANIFPEGAFNTYLAGPRVDNSIAYGGKFGGLQVHATYSLGRDAVSCAGETPGESKACRQVSASVNYGDANWGVGAWVDNRYGPAGATSDSDRLWEVNGYVGFAGAKLGLAWQDRKNDFGSDTVAGLPVDSRILKATVSYKIAPVLLEAQYIDYEAQHGVNAKNDASDIIVRATYSLSKQTSLYGQAALMNNKGSANFSPDVFAGAAYKPLPGKNQTGMMMGITHLF